MADHFFKHMLFACVIFAIIVTMGVQLVKARQVGTSIAKDNAILKINLADCQLGRGQHE
ncbi:MAG: hypothetical protein GY853_13655 [PVC group bacterium]|nr:hypothetical protein [PVC group bacterium]